MPAGYYLGEDITGMPQIYTDHHDHCPLITYNNTPALIDATKPENKSRIFLKKAKIKNVASFVASMCQQYLNNIKKMLILSKIGALAKQRKTPELRCFT